jgi:exoribonuclease R
MIPHLPANWIAGTLELASKIRYGLTSRGVPVFRFLPYDKSLPPMAVGCTARNLMYNVQAIIEPTTGATNTLKKGNLIQSNISEKDVLLATYAYDSQKELRKEFTEFIIKTPFTPTEYRATITEGFTFHIDPLTCMDVDDAFTIDVKADGTAILWIHIADVDEWVPASSPLDLNAQKRATTFYTPNGDAISPMLPRALSEGAASLLTGDSHHRPAVSLRLTWNGTYLTEKSWHLTMVRTQKRFSYESAQEAFLSKHPEMNVLYSIAKHLGAGAEADSHDIVAKLMILYNTEAGKQLKEASLGLLRRHAPLKQERISALQEFLKSFPNLQNLLFEAAEYCHPCDTNTTHAGLNVEAYAYATSPLRRYADIINQRALKAMMRRSSHTPVDTSLIIQLNRREKQAKAFQRDWFFSTALLADPVAHVKGLVLSEQNEKGKVNVFVDSWKRTIKVSELEPTLKRGDSVIISWYEDRTQPRWKERIVFASTKADDIYSTTGSCTNS